MYSEIKRVDSLDFEGVGFKSGEVVKVDKDAKCVILADGSKIVCVSFD